LFQTVEEFGAVRAVSPNGQPELVIYVENAGDFVVPALVPFNSNEMI
jgi:hypothetical protein